MNELVKITEQSGKRLVDARELHQVLKVETFFKDWIKRRIDEYKFVKNVDFFAMLKNEHGENQTVTILTNQMKFYNPPKN